MSILLLTFINLFLVLLIVFLSHFKWCIRTLRSIAHPKNQGGYIKLIQIGIIFTLILMFLCIFFYYVYNRREVDSINVLLTVVVGWLGLVIGRFFGENAMDSLQEKQLMNANRLVMNQQKLESLMEKYKKFLERFVG